mmetsp:Transcript_71130/g.148762  ORF Transcript_71130/g.148762 Transcript_71130/m.148762 type:complete len:278 (-) Transcript_71130:108-941(-)
MQEEDAREVVFADWRWPLEAAPHSFVVILAFVVHHDLVPCVDPLATHSCTALLGGRLLHVLESEGGSLFRHVDHVVEELRMFRFLQLAVAKLCLFACLFTLSKPPIALGRLLNALQRVCLVCCDLRGRGHSSLPAIVKHRRWSIHTLPSRRAKSSHVLETAEFWHVLEEFRGAVGMSTLAVHAADAVGCRGFATVASRVLAACFLRFGGYRSPLPIVLLWASASVALEIFAGLHAALLSTIRRVATLRHASVGRVDQRGFTGDLAASTSVTAYALAA